MYLIDTNVISELRKRRPNQGVLDFFQQVDAANEPCYISVITLGEIKKGIAMLVYRGGTVQSQQIQQWYDHDLQTVVSNVLAFDSACAQVWGELLARNPHNPIDKQLAATALLYDLTLITRNVKHVANTSVKIIDPFNE